MQICDSHIVVLFCSKGMATHRANKLKCSKIACYAICAITWSCIVNEMNGYVSGFGWYCTKALPSSVRFRALCSRLYSVQFVMSRIVFALENLPLQEVSIRPSPPQSSQGVRPLFRFSCNALRRYAHVRTVWRLLTSAVTP